MASPTRRPRTTAELDVDRPLRGRGSAAAAGDDAVRDPRPVGPDPGRRPGRGPRGIREGRPRTPRRRRLGMRSGRGQTRSPLGPEPGGQRRADRAGGLFALAAGHRRPFDVADGDAHSRPRGAGAERRDHDNRGRGREGRIASRRRWRRSLAVTIALVARPPAHGRAGGPRRRRRCVSRADDDLPCRCRRRRRPGRGSTSRSPTSSRTASGGRRPRSSRPATSTTACSSTSSARPRPSGVTSGGASLPASRRHERPRHRLLTVRMPAPVPPPDDATSAIEYRPARWQASLDRATSGSGPAFVTFTAWAWGDRNGAASGS